MNNNHTKNDSTSSDTPPSTPQTTPKGIGYGHPEYQFVQAIMEMQKSLGEINASIKDLNRSVDSTKAKVDDLVKWKHMIVGGAVVMGIIIGGIFTIGSKLFDHVSFNVTTQQQPDRTTK